LKSLIFNNINIANPHAGGLFGASNPQNTLGSGSANVPTNAFQGGMTGSNFTFANQSNFLLMDIYNSFYLSFFSKKDDS